MSAQETAAEKLERQARLQVVQARAPHMLSSRRCRGALIQIMGFPMDKPAPATVPAPRAAHESMWQAFLGLFHKPHVQGA